MPTSADAGIGVWAERWYFFFPFIFLPFFHLANRSQCSTVHRMTGHGDSPMRAISVLRLLACLHFATACTQAAEWPPITAAAEASVQTKCCKLVELTYLDQ
ncbi:hypothetical protein CABS01_00124 [Colletotrichum abscissum]|uniref:uncharacterized protein n=1 Tax=Colletotrichum abscissum TaxID=1671311 RepID=UPI0027D55D14|nr:uncharacterized protein CABS01_00124 [Colletotrichum abscissum]KAK1525035.1 hypothetical protein CABS01_00124 [Colletotrichum abscissum]